MLKKILLIGCSFFLLNCSNTNDIIPQKKMTQVLLELHLAEALSQHVPKDSLSFLLKNEDSIKNYTARILNNNQITEKEFQQSMNYYSQHVELLDSMYQQILTQIAVLNTQKN